MSLRSEPFGDMDHPGRECYRFYQSKSLLRDKKPSANAYPKVSCMVAISQPRLFPFKAGTPDSQGIIHVKDRFMCGIDSNVPVSPVIGKDWLLGIFVHW
jgi:hypothetical protein